MILNTKGSIFLFTYIVFSFLFSSCTSTGVREPSNISKPIHFIFTVHGISGNATTFGALNSALTEHLNKLVPSYQHRVITHTYSTGNNDLNTYNFSQQLGLNIQQVLRENKNTKNKISIVSHSQGGLISWIWYLKSLAKDPGYENFYDDAVKVDGFLTLGSPMWGSKLANLAHDKGILQKIQNLAKKLNINPPMLGKKELAEMAHGSDTIYKFRKKSIFADQNNINVPARVLAIAGVFPESTATKVRNLGLFYRTLLMWGEQFAGSGDGFRLESDIAVTLPMARFNFFYSPPKFKGDILNFEDFYIFKNEKYDRLSLVESPHVSWNQEKFYDIAEVPAECSTIKEGKTCTHPSYPYILNFLSNCTEYTGKCNLNEIHNTLFHFIKSDRLALHSPNGLEPKNMHSMVLDFNLILPDNFDETKFSAKDFKYEFLNEHLGNGINVHDPSYRFILARNSEIISKVVKLAKYINEDNQIEKHLRVTLYGHILPNYAKMSPPYNEYQAAIEKGITLPLKIYLPNLPVKTAYVKVKPTYSTFIEFDYR